MNHKFVVKAIFYSNPSNPTAKQITLKINEPFLTFYDKERGYVRKETLLSYNLIESEINHNSCITEYIETEHGATELIRLPIY
jgi:hypothetical protein